MIESNAGTEPHSPDTPLPTHALPPGTDPKIQRMADSLKHTDRYDFATLFPKLSGMRAKADVKRRVRMLASIEGRLDTLLYPGENIEYIASAVLNSWAEQYFMGVWSMTINRTLLVFTQYRALLLYSDAKGRAKQQAWQIPYHRLQKYGAAVWVGSVKFKLDDGKTYKFAQMKKADRRNLREYMQSRLGQPVEDRPEFPSHKARDPLCPGCWSPVPPKIFTCEQCEEPFIDPKVPAILSLVVPGTGDLYMGHTTLGVVELLGFGFLLFVLLGMVVNDPQSWPFALLAILIANTVDALVTHHIARKGVIARRHTFGKGTKPAKHRFA